MTDFTSTLSQPPNRVFISYLTRDSDGHLYNADTSQFEDEHLSDLVGVQREPYRITYEERAPGSYFWDLDVTGLALNGTYSYKSRELSGGIEYDNVKEEAFKVVAGVLQSSDIDLILETEGGLALFVYIKQVSTGLFFKSSDGTFAALDLAGENVADRIPFRVSYLEPTPGNYSVSIDGALFDDGNYEVRTFKVANDVEIEAGLPAVISIQDSKEQVGVTFNTVALSESTGGVDNLRYITSNSQGVEGATVVVYLKSDFDQGDFNRPFGSTLTRADGRWTNPVRVPAGNTYKVAFQKENFFGPDTSEVVV